MPLRNAGRTVSVAPMEHSAAARRLRPLWLTLAAILLLSLFTGEIRDTDIWPHLKTGQHSLETRALTVPDPFSYTSGMGAANYPGEEVTRYFNLTHEWLAQIVMYLIYSVAEFPGLVLARAALLMVFCTLAGWMQRYQHHANGRRPRRRWGRTIRHRGSSAKTWVLCSRRKQSDSTEPRQADRLPHQVTPRLLSG